MIDYVLIFFKELLCEYMNGNGLIFEILIGRYFITELQVTNLKKNALEVLNVIYLRLL